jgi:hypothetical protein
MVGGISSIGVGDGDGEVRLVGGDSVVMSIDREGRGESRFSHAHFQALPASWPSEEAFLHATKCCTSLSVDP